MTVSGFSIIRNAVLYGYPIVEAISSILPLCDEFIVNVGHSEDETLELVRSLSSAKLRIIEQKWDMGMRQGGKLLSTETNRALAECTGDWCFYIQADEVLHEKYYPVVRSAMERYLRDEAVEGLEFRYKHFYGSYDYYQDNYRRWYRKETRVIRRHPNIVSWGDAMDFRHRNGSRLSVERIDAEIYHYGWVRPPNTMIRKTYAFQSLYHDDAQVTEIMTRIERPYTDLGHLKRFTDSHPAVMRARIADSQWEFDPQIENQPPDWIRYVAQFFHPVTKRVRRLKNVLLGRTNTNSRV